MRALWQMWSDLLDEKTCEEIISHARKLPAEAAGVGHERRCDETVRDSVVRWVHPDNDDFKAAFAFVDHYFEWANANAFAADTKFVRNMQFTEYHASSAGHYKWHQDTFLESSEVYARKLSMVIQLSDPQAYEGGALDLDVSQRPDPAQLRARGTVIVFPSFIFHRVLPVTKGERCSLVVWKEGPPWR